MLDVGSSLCFFECSVVGRLLLLPACQACCAWREACKDWRGERWGGRARPRELDTVGIWMEMVTIVNLRCFPLVGPGALGKGLVGSEAAAETPG